MVTWLRDLGAEVTGYALPPATTPALFDVLELERACHSYEGDIRELDKIRALIRSKEPHFVFHLAAQSLVRRGHAEPLETFDVNIRGTAAVLEAIRQVGAPCTVVIVSSDKCYENREWVHGYRENDRLGGHDPYSASKAATEIITNSYRQSFFSPSLLGRHGVAVSSARAGNVIGGGDWAADRIVPDAVIALNNGQPIGVRNPRAVRPWQHVLEPLSGYLTLASRLSTGSTEERAEFCGAWNFGPLVLSNRPVATLVREIIQNWGDGDWKDQSDPEAPHESGLLALSIDKAVSHLAWQPRWAFRQAVAETVEWYRHYYRSGIDAARAHTLEQVRAYARDMAGDASESSS